MISYYGTCRIFSGHVAAETPEHVYEIIKSSLSYQVWMLYLVYGVTDLLIHSNVQSNRYSWFKDPEVDFRGCARHFGLGTWPATWPREKPLLF